MVKLGGPVYRIGVGGGAASSVAVQGDDGRSAALDFGAVQRGDAEMGNRLNRVIRMCLEAGKNPILGKYRFLSLLIHILFLHNCIIAFHLFSMPSGSSYFSANIKFSKTLFLKTYYNFVLAIHDQGAGGNGNVLKELVEPEGAAIFTKEFKLGDPTITTMELWGAEYQENNALLCAKEDRKILEGNFF